MAVNKVVYGTTVLVDLTGDTVTAATLMQGYTAHDRSGALITGTASSGGGDTYTRTVVVPQQTVTPNSSRMAAFTSTEYFVDGEYYVVTCDGTEYIVTSETLWSNNVVLGDAQVVWATSDVLYPFALITDGSAREGYFTTTSQHTIKVEHLEFVDGPLTIIPKNITTNGTYNASGDNADGYSSVTVNVPSGGGTYQAKTNISPTTSSQTITPDSGYDALSSVQINAMPSGTAGTPTATKGTVSNHSVSVTPSVTNTTGYITGGTKTGTAVTVSASELVSGNKAITDNGTNIDVTNYATVSVNVSGGGSVEFPTFSATVDEETGEIASITCDKTYAECLALIEDGNELAHMVITGSGYSIPCFGFVDVSAIEYDVFAPDSDELIGSINYYLSGTIDFEQASSGSSMNVQVAQSTTRATSSTYTKLASLTCSVSGTYDVYWDCFRSTTGGTSGSQLYIGGTASGNANTTFSNHAQNNHRTDVQINANQEVAVYARSRGNNYYAYCGQLTIVQTA